MCADGDGKVIKAQLLPISNATADLQGAMLAAEILPDLRAAASHELAFMATVPPLGYAEYTISADSEHTSANSDPAEPSIIRSVPSALVWLLPSVIPLSSSKRATSQLMRGSKGVRTKELAACIAMSSVCWSPRGCAADILVGMIYQQSEVGQNQATESLVMCAQGVAGGQGSSGQFHSL